MVKIQNYIKELYYKVVDSKLGGWQMSRILRTSLILLLILAGMAITIPAAMASNDTSDGTSICGDGVCTGSETLNSCPKDCREQIPDYASCLFDEGSCVSNEMRSDAINIVIIIFVIATIIYLKYKKFI